MICYHFVEMKRENAFISLHEILISKALLWGIAYALYGRIFPYLSSTYNAAACLILETLK